MEEKFYYTEGSASVKNLLAALVTEITQNAGIYNWNLVYPTNIEELTKAQTEEIDLITDDSKTDKVKTKFNVNKQNDKCILSTTTSYGKTFYVKIERPKAELTKEEIKVLPEFDSLHTYTDGYVNSNPIIRHRTDAEVLEILNDAELDGQNKYDIYVNAMTKTNTINHFEMQISDTLNGDDLGGNPSIPSRFSWYKKLQTTIKDWLPVEYWINVTKDSINLVLRGDPSADVAPYDNYLTSYAYIGALKPVEDSALTDDKYNFAITTSSDLEPIYSNKYGERTATGINDVCMIANKAGIPIQPHYPAFYSTNPFMDKLNFNGSRWNHKKHQFSDITLVHPVDMERGKMINILTGDASAINDTDKLAYKKDTDDEEYYKKFAITAPFNFLNNSSNINYCLAIRCYKTTE